MRRASHRVARGRRVVRERGVRLAVWATLASMGLIGCGAAAPPPPKGRAKGAAPMAPATRAPAYFVTKRMFVEWDEGTEPSLVMRDEPAIVERTRLVLRGGKIVWAPTSGPALDGLSSIPMRLGGGYLLWSDTQTYRAQSFSGDLRPFYPEGANGGVRPWLSSVVLRTRGGLVPVDATTGEVRPSRWAGLDLQIMADVVAVDDRRGVVFDPFERIYVTLDGATARDVTDELEEQQPSGFTAERILAAVEARRPVGLAAVPEHDPAPADIPISRELPGDELPRAVASGVTLPSGDLLTVLEGDLVRISSSTGAPTGPRTQLPEGDVGQRCEAVSGGSHGVTVACWRDDGAMVLEVSDDPNQVFVEATFGPVTGFQADERGRLAAWGRCGSAVPSRHDFEVEGAESGDGPSLGAEDEATICVRVARGRWVERWVRGDAARRLYRWVLGPDGTVVALVTPPDPGEPGDSDDDPDADPRVAADPAADARDAAAPTRTSQGVEVREIPVTLAALGGGQLPAVALSRSDRIVDRDVWQDDEGTIHGWLERAPASELPSSGEDPDEEFEGPNARPDEVMVDAPAPRRLPVAGSPLGVAFGYRLGPRGELEREPLPAGTEVVVRGGPFALARTDTEAGPALFETTDGGASWHPIAAPPVGAITFAPSPDPEVGCSRAGCHWGTGVVRMGWGHAEGAPAEPAEEPSTSPPPHDSHAALSVACRLEAEPPTTDDPWLSFSRPASAFAAGFVPPPLAPRGRVERVAAPWSSARLAVVLPERGDPGHVLLGEGTFAWGGSLGRPHDVGDVPEARNTELLVGVGPGRFLGFAPNGPELVWWERDVVRSLGRLPRSNGNAAVTASTLAVSAAGPLGILGVPEQGNVSWVGELDVGALAVGPLRTLAGVDRARGGETAACAPRPDSWRALVRLGADLSITVGEGQPVREHPSRRALALVRVSEDEFCVDAVEVEGRGFNVVARAAPSTPRQAVARAADRVVAASCEVRGRDARSSE